MDSDCQLTASSSTFPRIMETRSRSVLVGAADLAKQARVTDRQPDGSVYPYMNTTHYHAGCLQVAERYAAPPFKRGLWCNDCSTAHVGGVFSLFRLHMCMRMPCFASGTIASSTALLSALHCSCGQVSHSRLSFISARTLCNRFRPSRAPWRTALQTQPLSA